MTSGINRQKQTSVLAGDIASLDSDPAAAVMAASAEGLGVEGLAGAGGDWRLPNSPAMALQLAQEDLAERLAHLYAEKVRAGRESARGAV